MNDSCPRDPRPTVCIYGLLASVMVCLPLAAWPGYQYSAWQKVTAWSQPKLESDQAGRPALSPLLASDGENRSDEIRAWEVKRARMATIIRTILGEPTNLEPPKLEVEGLETEILDDHIRQHIRIRSERDDWIPAYLLLPRPLPKAPLPALICLHQTVAQGKKEPCGMEGSHDLALARQLVRRGYVCIAPDMIGFGDASPPAPSLTMKVSSSTKNTPIGRSWAR